MQTTKIDANVIGKGLEAINNVAKLANNMTEKKPVEKKVYKDGDNTNQPHNQTVEVKVGSDQAQKPTIVHEKKETHIHKPFPEGRELSERECAVETLRLQLEAQEKQSELEYRRWVDDENRKERREREEYARKERERKREEDRRFAKRMLIGCGIAGAVGLGLTAYSIYSGSRDPSGRRLALQSPKGNASLTITTTPINAEGSVE